MCLHSNTVLPVGVHSFKVPGRTPHCTLNQPSNPCQPPQDCSIDILPMTDSALGCSEPLNTLFPSNQLRGYYATTKRIQSLIPNDLVTRYARGGAPGWLGAGALGLQLQLSTASCACTARDCSGLHTAVLLLHHRPAPLCPASLHPPRPFNHGLCRPSHDFLRRSSLPACSTYMFAIDNPSDTTVTMSFWAVTTDPTITPDATVSKGFTIHEAWSPGQACASGTLGQLAVESRGCPHTLSSGPA